MRFTIVPASVCITGSFLLVNTLTSSDVIAQGLPTGVIAVDIDSTDPTPDGESWASAFSDLEDALAEAQSDTSIEEIWVAEGTYKPDNSDPGNRSLSFVLTNLAPDDELRILGGFVGSETDESDRNWGTNVTILSADIGTQSDNSDNSYHVIIAKPGPQTVIVDGFTIRDGNADGTGGPHDDKGGGALLTGSGFDGPRFANCIFTNNVAVLGGGLASTGAVVDVRNSSFTINEADEGGGIYSEGDVALRNCIFRCSVSRNGQSAVHGKRVTYVDCLIENDSKSGPVDVRATSSEKK